MAIAEGTMFAIAKKVLDESAPSILKKVSEKLGSEIAKVRVQFTKTFQDHLASSISRATYVKTIVSKDRAVKLREIYVNLMLTQDDGANFSDDELDPTKTEAPRFIVSGTGGAGKTILMKHLLIRCTENFNGMIPLFVELRNLDFSKSRKLAEIILEGINADVAPESSKLFEAALEEGLFHIFLDGFDEINPDHVAGATKMISAFSKRYQKCSIILSTRPGTGIHSLVNFEVFHVSPLSKEQAIDLIKKTKFDEISKAKFQDALESGLYDKHNTMMSIPILVVMMLLTFRTYGEIPNRMTVFYNQAFDTLYSIHDAEGKESYKRVHSSQLPPDIFRRVLNAFCYSSLCKYEIEFSRESLQFYIQKAIKITQVDCKVEDFIADLIKNVCVLQPDGMSFLFVHRSFQEFFAASFVSRYSGKQVFKAYDQLVTVAGPAVIEMLIEIDRAKFERQWVLPKLEKYVADLEKRVKLDIPEKIKPFADRIIFRGDRPLSGMTYTRGGLWHDGFLLSSATVREMRPDLMFANLEFGSLAIEKLQIFNKHQSELNPDRSQSKILNSKSVYSINLKDENLSLITDSNFDNVYSNYILDVRTIMQNLSERVQNDVVVEDIIFE
jgi:hypothetical protein